MYTFGIKDSALMPKMCPVRHKFCSFGVSNNDFSQEFKSDNISEIFTQRIQKQQKLPCNSRAGKEGGGVDRKTSPKTNTDPDLNICKQTWCKELLQNNKIVLKLNKHFFTNDWQKTDIKDSKSQDMYKKITLLFSSTEYLTAVFHYPINTQVYTILHFWELLSIT